MRNIIHGFCKCLTPVRNRKIENIFVKIAVARTNSDHVNVVDLLLMLFLWQQTCFGYPPWRTVFQFSISPLCNSWGVWWGSEADDKVAYGTCQSDRYRQDIRAHAVLFDSPLRECVQTPVYIRRKSFLNRISVGGSCLLYFVLGNKNVQLLLA